MKGHASKNWIIGGLYAVTLLFVAGCDQQETAAPSSSTPQGATAGIRDANVNLLSFEAIYEMSLERTSSSSNIAAYEGLLVLDTIDACDGFSTNQRISALVGDQEGKSILSDFVMTSWESTDRTLFRFESKVKMGGILAEETIGRATRDNTEEDGAIIFETPDIDPVMLTPDIQFPTEYIVQLISAAKKGESLYQSLMTDGSSETTVFETVTFIGDKGNPEELEFEGAQLLEGLDHWPITMGYHNRDSKEGLPEVEMSMDMYENGVGTHIVMDYGDFALRAELKELKAVEGAGC